MFAVLVPVPVATVDEDDGPVFRQNDIGTAGELFVQRSVYGEAEAMTMKKRPEQAFGPGVLPRDSGHDPAAFLFIENVCHF